MSYKIKWSQTENNTIIYNKIDVFDTIGETETPNTQWSTSGCYGGTNLDTVRNTGAIIFGNSYFDQSYSGTTLGQLNLRFCAIWTTPSVNSFKRFGYRWTGLEPQGFSYYTSNSSSVSMYNPALNDVASVQTLTTSGPSHWFISPIKNLQINNLILYPRFCITTTTFTGYRSAEPQESTIGKYYTNVTSTSVFKEWVDIKPEDNTPAGNDYDDDLWSYGYKILDSDEEHYVVQYVTGVYLTPYYGNSSKIYDVENNTYITPVPTPDIQYGIRNVFALASDNDEYPILLNESNRKNPIFTVMLEGYNSELQSVIYCNINGITWTKQANTTSAIVENGEMFGTNRTGENLTTTLYFNTVNLAYENTSYGGIIKEQSPVSDPVHIIIPGIKNLQTSINVQDTDIWGTWSSSSGTTNRFYPTIDISNGSIVYITNRPFYRQMGYSNTCYSIEHLWKNIASIGCYVGSRLTDVQNAPLGQSIGNNDNIYLGEMLSDGMTTGRMLQGGEISQSVQASIDDIIQGTPYIPIEPTPHNPSGEGIDDKDKGTGDFLPSGGLKLIGSGGFVSYYLLGYSDLASLQSALSTVASTFWESIGTATDARTSNLLQYISSLKWYAIDILSGNAGIYADVTVNAINFGFDGNCTLPLAGITKLSSAVRVYDMGSVTIPYKIQNTETFLDKDPFSTVQIYLPFCGLYPVKADFVIGNTIKFYYIVDLTTGMCTALVTNDRQTLLNVSGKIGVDYCITGNDIITQSEKLAGSYLNAGVNTISGTVGLASSVMSGNIAGAAASGISLAGNIAKASIDIASSKRAVPVAIGSGSGFGSAFAHDTPCVIVNPPAVKIPDNYGHTQGYIFNESVNLSSLSDGAFVVCDNPDLSGITADKMELDLLYQILSSGFYI